MEGLVNPKTDDINSLVYLIWKDRPNITVEGIWFIQREHNHFGIESKIKQLDDIINHQLNLLNDISYEDKSNLIDKIKIKQQTLQVLMQKYEVIRNIYFDYDKYYREDLFEFYLNKYKEIPLFHFAERKKFLSIIKEIQELLYQKFIDFCDAYCNIRDDFFEINDYILRIKKFFNFQDKEVQLLFISY